MKEIIFNSLFSFNYKNTSRDFGDVEWWISRHKWQFTIGIWSIWFNNIYLIPFQIGLIIS